MSSDDKIVEALELFCQAMENAIAVLRQNLGVAGQPKSWDPNKIKWQVTEGFKGIYERYPPEARSPRQLKTISMPSRDLKDHKGRLSRDGYFYWVFSAQATIGRKKREAKKYGERWGPLWQGSIHHCKTGTRWD